MYTIYTQLCPTTVHGILQARILEWVAVPFSWGSSQPGIEPRSPAMQADSLLAEPPGKPKNTGVGSLPLLQQIFLNQELNGGLLHCRLILYQLSYQGRLMLPMKSDRYTFCFSLLSAESALSLSFTVKSLAPPSASLNWWSKLLTPLLLKSQFPMKIFI